eukprot:7382971-Prymnesium_polylepis.2
MPAVRYRLVPMRAATSNWVPMRTSRLRVKLRSLRSRDKCSSGRDPSHAPMHNAAVAMLPAPRWTLSAFSDNSRGEAVIA